jgi:nucleoside triphosphate pyrophosphatase
MIALVPWDWTRPPSPDSLRLVLASASPRRAELLTASGFVFDTRPADLDERVLAGESPTAHVLRLASAKSASAHDPAIPDQMTLGADTVVVVDDSILGKPVERADAAAMLKRLSGREHEVLTGVSLRLGTTELSEVTRTEVEFAHLSDQDIAWYVESGEGLDKAGAYAIQGRAARFIPRIRGSYSNVVGLPVSVVTKLVEQIAGLAGRATDLASSR